MKKVDVILKASEPYPFMVLGNAFPDAVKKEMLKRWPERQLRKFDYSGGLKDNFNRSHPEWESFMKEDEFWGSLLSISELMVVGQRFSEMLGESFRFTDVKVEFSSLPSGGGLLPHPDGPEKVMTAIVYIPDEVWHPSWGGEFRIVRDKKNPKGDFSGRSVQWADVDLVAESPFLPNRVTVFARRPWSLHGVRPVMCPSGFTRKSLTINWMGERISK